MPMNEMMEHEQKLEQPDTPDNGSEPKPPGVERTLSEREAALEALRKSLKRHDEILTMLKQELAEQESTLEILRSSKEDSSNDRDYRIALALTLANAAYDALLVVDELMHVIATNQSAEIMFNDPHPAGKLLSEVTALPELETMVEDALANEEENLEEQVTYQRHPYRLRVQVIRRDGNLFIGLALQDVSELVRLNRARRDMVANISHELRTPIANIRLIIDGLFHEQEKPKRKQSTSALRAIARETDSLLWLVQELLDLSMIELGQAILRAVGEPIKEIVSEAIERVIDQSDAKEIEIVDEVPTDLQVLADRDQVRRVLINLIHNAIKWSPPGEKIRVRAESNGDEVTISVLDRGPGVPEDHRERIFERFYQVDPSRSGGEGTGLGLAISKHIVEAHGGRIWVEDNPDGKDGKGGNFKFTLPSAEGTY